MAEPRQELGKRPSTGDGEQGPIFIVGRQHSGNTMFAHLLGNVPGVLAMTGEGQFFERRREAERADPGERPAIVARLIQESDASVVDDETRSRLTDELAARPGAGGASELYASGMRLLTREKGQRRWAQKATSHIFWVEDVLEVFPDARFVFLARNPLDIGASFVRRGNRRKLVRMAVGWNRGVRLADGYRDSMEGRFLVLRYEDLVSDPEEHLPPLFEDLGLPYRDDVTDIPYVNRSGDVGPGQGLDDSRVFCYPEELGDRDRDAILRAVDGDLLDRCYPELAARHEQRGALPRPAEAGLFLQGVGSFVLDHLRRGLREPAATWRRLTGRIGRR